MSVEALNSFYHEVQTVEMRFKTVEGNLRGITLEHYSQFTSNYYSQIAEQRELALTVIMLLNTEQIQFQANRLQIIDERLNSFWEWYSGQMEKMREDDFHTSEFTYYLETYLPINNLKQDLKNPWTYYNDDFLYALGDAVMYKQGGVKYLLYYIKNIMGIVPKLVGNSEERAEEESRLTNRATSDLTLICTLTEIQRNTLFTRLSVGQYIDSTVTFAEFSELLLGSEPLVKPLHWLKSNRDLAYLLNTMYERKMINSRIWKSRIEKRGLFLKESAEPFKAQDLAQAITDYQNKGNPTEANNLNTILEEVKALRD